MLAAMRRYVELEGQGAWHMKASLVQQAATSRYNLTETQLGGAFSRHDLSIKQVSSFQTLCCKPQEDW